MIEPMSFDKITEDDVTRAIEAIGGKRASEDDSRETDGNADYVLGNAVIELKFLDSERLEALTDKSKLSALFRWDDAPVVVLDEQRLDEGDRRKLDAIRRQPIENQIKKASKQFKAVREREPQTQVNVCMVVNNGYWSLDHDSLKEYVANRATHSTREIDYVIVAGFYYHSDGFDNYFIAPVDSEKIRSDALDFDCLDALKRGLADGLFETQARKFMLEQSVSGDHHPVADVSFEHGGKTYIKPAPAMGGPSSFYRHGRPRHNSTGLEKCPMVAVPFPDFDESMWDRLKAQLHDSFRLQDSFRDWRAYVADLAEREGGDLKPFVRVAVSLDDWPDGEGPLRFQQCCQMAADKFNKRALSIRDSKMDLDEARIELNAFVCAHTTVVGRDMANDYSSIIWIRNASLGELASESVLVDKARIFHEHAVSVATAYAFIYDVPVRYSRDLTYAWH